jgi:hypothetical protein
VQEARAALAAEWQTAAPSTPDAIAAFYRHARGLADDLEAWHQTPVRQEATRMLAHVAQQAPRAREQLLVVDIGAGAGHDLRAIRDAVPDAELWGVEPSSRLRSRLLAHDLACCPDVGDAPVEDADLLVCVDVLEHIPDPETFLAAIAQRARVGCLLFEMTATHDTGTPLHLAANHGWHPGHVLEQHGWELADTTPSGRVNVWRRVAATGRERAGLLLCAYRSVSAAALRSIMDLCAGSRATVGNRWRLRTKTGDALIARSRNILVTSWWRETNDDVFLMVDDDVVFSPADADRLAELCRSGHAIVCGAYPTHNGAHLACRLPAGVTEVAFGPGQPPLEILYAATGFMAVHRRVIDALVATLPLCHADQPWSFYPLFEARVVEGEAGAEWLSEDYGFSAAARAHGCGVWLDPQTILQHLGEAGISVRNMAAMKAAVQGV